MTVSSHELLVQLNYVPEEEEEKEEEDRRYVRNACLIQFNELKCHDLMTH